MDQKAGEPHAGGTQTEVKNGQWLTRWLDERRFSDVQIAERLGVTPATIANYKRQTWPLKRYFVLALEAIDAADLEQRLAQRNGG